LRKGGGGKVSIGKYRNVLPEEKGECYCRQKNGEEENEKRLKNKKRG